MLPLLLAPLLAPGAPPARNVLDRALAEGSRRGVNVLAIFGASWCPWCRRFDRLLAAPELTSRYAIVHLTVRERGEKRRLENPGWAGLMRDYRGATDQDVPYVVILSPDGRKLGDSVRVAPGEIPANAGYPQTRDEWEAFSLLMRGTAQWTADDLDRLFVRVRS